MSLGEAWWFVGQTGELAPQQVLEFLRKRGISLRHPRDGRIWVFDDIGSRRAASLDFIHREWTANRVLTMQLWIDADTDVVITTEPEHSLLTFSLDGLLTTEASNLVAALILGAGAKFNTPLLVVDRLLPDRSAEWIPVALGSRPIPYEPDLLLMRGHNGEQILTVRPNSWLA
jgi:hypothetical protein